MASAAKLSVQIEADIAALRTGLEETVRRVQSTEKTVKSAAGSMQKNFDTSLAGIHASYVKAAIGIGAAMATIGKAWQLANTAAAYEEQREQLNALASEYSTTASIIVSSIQEATSGQISKIDAMSVALTGMARGLKPEQLIALANAAEVLGDTVGKTATVAFQELTEGLITGRERGLMQYIGASGKLKDAIGDQAKGMSEAEKVTARYNIIIEEAARLNKSFGDSAISAADQMDAARAAINDASLSAGKAAATGFFALAGAFDWVAAGAMKATAALTRFSAMTITDPKVKKDMLDFADNLSGAAEELTGKAAKNFETITTLWADTVAETNKNAINSLKKGLAGATGGAAEPTAKPPGKVKSAAGDPEKDRLRAIEEAYRKQQDIYKQDYATYKAISDSKFNILQERTSRETNHIKATEDDKLAQISLTYDKERALKETQVASLQGQIPYLEKIKGSEDEIYAVKGNIALITEQISSLEQEYVDNVLANHKQGVKELEENYTRIADKVKVLSEGVQSQTISAMPLGSEVSGILGMMQTGKELENLMAEEQSAYQSHLDTIIGMDEAAKLKREELNKSHTTRMTALDRSQYANRLNIASNTFGMMANIAAQYYEASGRQSEAAFKAYQALQIAQTVVSTAAGIMQIWGDASAGPWYVKAGLSAMVAAMGAAQIATISSARPGSGSTTSAGVPAGSYPSPGTAATTPTATATTNERIEATPTIQIYVQGNIIDQDKFARELVPALRRAMGDGVR